MKKSFIVIAMMLLAASTFAQSKASLKGILIDSVTKFKLEFATVAVVNAKDTSLISYTVTLKDGSFKLTGLPANKETKLIVSYAGYKTIRMPLTLKPGVLNDLGEIKMPGTTLKEINVRGERTPILIKKDTIEFNTEAFKTRPNAIVEEMLRLLPGVQIDYDGTITFKGKAVNKLLIDGKRFFGTDPKVATKNLTADMVANVQMYDDREDDPDHKLTDNEVGKILNLKMKSAIKKSTMGKVYAGGGTRDRYEAGGIVSTFRDTLQVSVIAVANNLNKTGFSTGDLYTMGGFNRSGLGGVQQLYGQGSGGLERVFATGLNINNDYGKRLKTNLSYFYSNVTRDENTKTFKEQTLSNTLLSTSATNSSHNNYSKHVVDGFVESVPDTIKRIRYQPRLELNPERQASNGLTNTFNTQTPKLSDLINNTISVPFNNSFSHSFSYYTKLGHKGKSLNIYHSLTLNKSGSDDYNYYNLVSYIPTPPSQMFDRYIDNNRLANNAGLQVTYNNPFNKKLTGDIFSNTRYYVTSEEINTFLKNSTLDVYDQFLASQSNKLVRSHFIQNLRPQLTYQLSKKVQIRGALDFEAQYLTNTFTTGIPNVGKQYFYLFPSFRLTTGGFDFNYSEYIDQTEIYQIQPIVKELNPLNKFIGNPDLEPNRVRSISASYSKYVPDKQIFSSIRGNALIADNARISKNTIDASGVTTQTYINSGSAVQAYLYGSINKQFKKTQTLQVSLNENAGVNYGLTTFLLNADQARQSTYSIRFGQGVYLNYKSRITLNSTYNLSGNLTRYANVNYNSVNSLRHTAGADLSVRWPAKIIFDVNYAYNYNTQVPDGFPKSANLLNIASTVLMLKKDLGQIKLAVYDLLNQNISVNRYASTNSVTTNELQILRRYFLLTLQYRIITTKK